MIPIGNADMINNSLNHRAIVDGGGGNIIIIGSGFHKAMEFAPVISGVTPDIKGAFNAGNAEGKVVFATLQEICNSVDLATSLKLRKDPITAKEQDADPQLLEELRQERINRLATYKTNFKRWINSLAPESMETTRVTFIRNIYPMDDIGHVLPTKVKAAWVTGLGVEAALDCGSGKVALVDGVTGAQLGGNEKWPTNEDDARWTSEDIEKYADMCRALCQNGGGGGGTIAYGTGNWRKEHMATTVAPFKAAMSERNIDFNLLPGELEAKFGGISSLKCVVPYDTKTDHWVVMELGGGSTQISRFQRIGFVNLDNMTKHLQTIQITDNTAEQKVALVEEATVELLKQKSSHGHDSLNNIGTCGHWGYCGYCISCIACIACIACISCIACIACIACRIDISRWGGIYRR